MYGFLREGSICLVLPNCYVPFLYSAGNVGGCLSEATYCFFSYRSIDRKLYDVESPCPLSGT